MFHDSASGETPVAPSDQALFEPNTPIRLVHADVVAMTVGGISALLLQMLHPHALKGVLDHSTFRADMHGRLRRTARFIAVTTYAHRDEAARAIDRVNAIHEKVRGELKDGTPYSATDPQVLAWVHLAEATSFLKAHRRYVRTDMTQADRDRYFAQSAVIARRLHGDPVPESEDEARRLMEEMRPELRADAETRAVAREIIAHKVDGVAAAVQPLLSAAAIDLLPTFAARMLALRRPGLSALPLRAGTYAMGRTLRWAFAAQRRD